MTAGKEPMGVRQVSQPARHDGFQGFPQRVEEGNRPICLWLGVVIFARLPKYHRDGVPEMCWAVPKSKAGTKKPMEAWEKDIQYLLKDAIRDPVASWGLVRRASSYRSISAWMLSWMLAKIWG